MNTIQYIFSLFQIWNGNTVGKSCVSAISSSFETYYANSFNIDDSIFNPGKILCSAFPYKVSSGIYFNMTELIIAFYVDFLILSLCNVCCLATWYDGIDGMYA